LTSRRLCHTLYDTPYTTRYAEQVPVEIRELVWDEANERHLAQHGVTIREVEQVLSNPHIVVRNRTRRRAQHLLIGHTHGGRPLTVALAKTRETGTWRPVTAYTATPAQQEVLARTLGSSERG
jgi:uncharacterized DUF497 family protein